jgi:hypothetical protein
MFEEYRRGRQGFYIVGAEGNYAVKSCGNNRILERDLETLEAARIWLTTYYPGVKLES